MTRSALLLGIILSVNGQPAAGQESGLANPVVIFETTRGEIWIELFPDKAPKTVDVFRELVRSGFYDEMLFHRVVRDFAIQTGLVTANGALRGQDAEAVENESDNRLKNDRGMVAMARLDRPHTATTEFYINVRDNRSLNFKDYSLDGWGYTVFGRVVDGMDVVDAIARVPTRRLGSFRDFPMDPVAVFTAYEAPAVGR